MDELNKNEVSTNESVDATLKEIETETDKEKVSEEETLQQPTENSSDSEEQLTESETQTLIIQEQNLTKKKSKAPILISVIVLILLITGAVCLAFFGNFSSSNKEDPINLFSEELVSVCKDNKWGFMNKSGELVIDYQFDSVGIFKEDGLAWVEIDGKCGYIDKTGKYVVNPQYDRVGPFCDGMACVVQDDLYGYINTLGEVVINFQYDEANPFHCGYAVVVLDDYWGIIDKTGKYVINPQYEIDDIFYTTRISEILRSTDDMSNLLIPVVKNDKYGYIDINNNTVINFQFDDATAFNKDGYAIVNFGEKCGLIDKTGSYVVNAKYDYISYGGKLYMFVLDDRCGLLSSDGTEIVCAQFDSIAYAGADHYIVDIGGKAGLINSNGEYVINPIYQSIGALFNELMLAKNNDKYGYVNTDGEVVIDFQFDDATEFMDCGLAKVYINGKYGYINTSGEYVINAEYNSGSLMYDDGYAWVVGDDKKVSVINSSAEIIASGFDGIMGNIIKICTESGCNQRVVNNTDFCEKHSFDFNKILEEVGYGSSSYASVSETGMNMIIKSYWYSYMEDFDNGADVALAVAKYLGCKDISALVYDEVMYITYGNYKIKMTYAFLNNYAYFGFDATVNSNN